MADTKPTDRTAALNRILEIRKIALAEILSKEGGFNHKSYFAELDEIKRRPHPLEWYEAVAMTCVIGNVRPGKINSMLNKLNYQRRLNNQPEKYDSFEQSLRKYVYPREFTSPVMARNLFYDLDHKSIWRTVEGHVGTLRDMGYEVFLNSGTLLGVVRDKALIAHDDDVDLAIVLKAKSEKKAAQEWMELRDILEKAGLLHTVKEKNPAIFKLTPAAGVNIDLFPAWQNNGKFFVFPHTYGTLEIEDVLPLKLCDVTGHPIPADPEKMLVENYGAGWQIPDPHFEFPWIQAKAKFSPFLEGLTEMTIYNPHPQPPRVILTYGTFDLFHHGHVRLLQRLSALGSELIVGVSTDEFNAIKGKQCFMPYEQRRMILESCRYVSRVIPEENWDQKRTDIVNYNVSTFAMGDDWAGKFDDLSDLAEVLYLPRTENVSTTELREQIGAAVLAG